MRTALVAALAICSACGDVPGGGGSGGGAAGGGGGSDGGAGGGIGAAFDREALSGTRLKVRYIQGEDGSRNPAGFFDSVRGDACYFGVADDGRTRCLPFENLGGFQGTLHADSACSEKLTYAVTETSCAMKYVAEWGTQCPQTRTFYAVSLFVPTTEADGGINLYFGSPASCIRRANEPLPPYTFYKIGAKIPATSFVAGEFKVEP